MTRDAAEGSTPAPAASPQFRRAACPGSFDPITNGHLDIFERSAALFDELVVLVTINPSKKTLFSLAERQDLIRQATAHLPNVVVDSMSGLLVDYAAANNISAVCKGLRVATDFDYEIQMAQMNYKIADVETLFLTTNPTHSFISSSLVKEVAKYGGDVSGLLPQSAHDALLQKIAEDSASH